MPNIPIGGKGKKNVYKCMAIVALYKLDPKKYTSYRLGKLFNNNNKTIEDIIHRDKNLYFKGLKAYRGYQQFPVETAIAKK